MRLLSLTILIFLATLGHSQFVPIAVMEIKKPEGLTYAANYYFNKWYAVSTVTPTLSNYDDVTTLTFSIAPALPAGLSFNTNDGTITGTPTEYNIAGSTYTITASNQAGSTQTTTDIYVIPANHTWSGGAFPDTNWSTGANWVGMNAPTSSDIAIFDNYCTDVGSGCNATIDASIDIQEIQMQTGYTGTVTQSGAFTITLGTDYRTNPGGIVMHAGTFVGGTGDIEMDVLQLTAGTFTSTSGNMRIGYNAGWSYSERSWVRAGVTWAHNNGTVIIDPTGNNTAYRQNGEFELDQTWALYNLEFDIDSQTTLGDGEISGHWLDIQGTVATISVANELHFRDGWGRYGTIQFYGSDVQFHCDAPTYDKCSDSVRDLDGLGEDNITELHFLGSSAQTYTYDAGADSWAEFVVNNSNGVTTTSTGDFSIAGLTVEDGDFQAPASSELYLHRDTDHSWRNIEHGFDLNGSGTFSHNNGTVVINAHTGRTDNRDCMTFTDDVTFYNLTVDCGAGGTNGYTSPGVDINASVSITVLNDLVIKDGRFDGSGNTITVNGDYYRECAQLDPGHDCADADEGTLTYLFDTNGSNIYIDPGADQYVSGNAVSYIINPGVGNTVTLNGVITGFGGSSDLTISSGTFHLASGGFLIGGDLINNGAVTCAANTYIQYDGSVSGTPGGGNDPLCYSNTPPVVTLPGGFGWADFSGNSSEETFSQINVAVLFQISVSHTLGSPTIEFRSSNTSWQTLADGASSNQNFIQGETLQFRATGTSGDQAMITVINVDNGSTTVDTITATVP